MKDFKRIDIVFENCNVVKIEPKDVEWFSLRNIETSLSSTGKKGEILEYKRCKSAKIIILNSALKNKTYFERVVEVNGLSDPTSSFLNHLNNLHNITHFDIIFNSGKSEYIAVPWDEISEEKNTLEKVDFGENAFTINITQ